LFLAWVWQESVNGGTLPVSFRNASPATNRLAAGRTYAALMP
jgi:hypothetical protein